MKKGSTFREQLVEFEKSYGSMKSRVMDLEEKTSRQEKESSRLEAKNKNLERKLNELSRQLKDAEKENQLLNLQVRAWFSSPFSFFFFFFFFLFMEIFGFGPICG